MIGLAVILATANMLLIGLATFLAVDAFGQRKMLQAQTDRADKLAQQLDALKLKDANASTQIALASEHRQEQRGDALEKEIADAPNPSGAGTGLEQLHNVIAADPGSPEPK
ncbi:MAG TPA: hypothetical protein VGG28_15145 [Kofleriaceae bacterium]